MVDLLGSVVSHRSQTSWRRWKIERNCSAVTMETNRVIIKILLLKNKLKFMVYWSIWQRPMCLHYQRSRQTLFCDKRHQCLNCQANWTPMELKWGTCTSMNTVCQEYNCSVSPLKVRSFHNTGTVHQYLNCLYHFTFSHIFMNVIPYPRLASEESEVSPSSSHSSSELSDPLSEFSVSSSLDVIPCTVSSSLDS